MRTNTYAPTCKEQVCRKYRLNILSNRDDFYCVEDYIYHLDKSRYDEDEEECYEEEYDEDSQEENY